MEGPLIAQQALAFGDEPPLVVPPPARFPKPPAALEPGVGIFFDERCDLREPEGTAFVAATIDAIIEHVPRRRRRKAADLAKFEVRIRKLLANAMHAYWYRKAPGVLYFRKADAKQYADKPNWMRHGGLAKAVDALVNSGSAMAIIGKKMPGYGAKPSWASSYSASHMLVDIAVERFRLSKDSIEWREPTERLVQLYGPKPKAGFDFVQGKLHARKGKPIAFIATEGTESWVAALEAVNAFYRRQQICVALSEVQWTAWLTEYNANRLEPEVPYRRPEAFKTDLYRVFNNGVEADPKFDQGGRLYGGWWISVPKRLRKAIAINGQPTVELDYAACHPRMLYHERGLEVDGEIYALPEIAAYERDTGVPTATYRPCIKWMMQVLLNSRGRPQTAEKPENVKLPPEISLEQLIRLIAQRHQPIADAFGTGVGLRLMRMESDIALEIVKTAMEEGWVALPIHDSFISNADKRERLETLMKDSYRKILGRLPSVRLER